MVPAKLFTLLLSCYLLSCSGSTRTNIPSAFFEGTISYKAEIVRKTNKYDSLLIEHIIGKNSVYYYKGGNNKIETPGALSPYLIYSVADNRVYTQRLGVDTIYWESCAGPGIKILKYTITPDKETVLGILCDELRVEFENKTVTSYFNADTLRIDPALHKANTLTNEDFFAEKKKALSLKFIVDKPDYKVTYTATSVIPAKLGDDIFLIPANRPLVEWK